MSFASTLKSAADQAHAAGQINALDRAALHNAANDQRLVVASEAAAAFSIGQFIGSIDWLKLVAQVQTMLPFILQLIQLFAKQTPAPAPMPAAQPTPPIGAA